jgi:hypothetical protein
MSIVGEVVGVGTESIWEFCDFYSALLGPKTSLKK